MKCLEPKVTLEDVQGSEDDWFCPLCVAFATLIHYAQTEYFGDDLEESPRSNVSQMEEWEMARDVFSEAPFEYRVAQKFKENIFDEETSSFLADTLGIVTGSSSSRTLRGCSQASERLDLLEEEDEEDDDFDHETEDPEEDSDMDMEEKLAKETIAKDELDALSVTSNADD